MAARFRPTLRLRAPETFETDFARWLELFEAGRYRESLDPLEAWWFPRRDAFGQGLIKLTVAMNQLETTDLTSGPRTLFIGARRQLKPFAPVHDGVDVDAARRLAAIGLRRLRERSRKTPVRRNP